MIQVCSRTTKTKAPSETAVYASMIEVACDERRSPRPPVMIRKMKVREAKGVWSRGIREWNCARGRSGRSERMIVGKSDMKARIW